MVSTGILIKTRGILSHGCAIRTADHDQECHQMSIFQLE